MPLDQNAYTNNYTETPFYKFVALPPSLRRGGVSRQVGPVACELAAGQMRFMRLEDSGGTTALGKAQGRYRLHVAVRARRERLCFF